MGGESRIQNPESRMRNPSDSGRQVRIENYMKSAFILDSDSWILDSQSEYTAERRV
jgi:hypothetical protein